MNVLNKSIAVRISVVICLIFSACDNPSDSESPPESGEILGTLTCSGTWPREGTIYLTINVNWPPMEAPYATKVIQESDLNDDMKYAYKFEEVTFGTYGAITVSWLDPNDSNPATNQHTLGAYGGSVQSDFIDASSVTVSEDEHELTGVDISVNLSLLQFGS